MDQEIATQAEAPFARLGRPTTPDELRGSGARRLVAIEAGELSAALRRVLTSTLLERVQGELDPRELASLVDAAERALQAEFFLARVHKSGSRPRPTPVRPARAANAALVSELARNGRTTSPDDLGRRGVRRVPAMGLVEMSFMIERAVNRALLARTPGSASVPGHENDAEHATDAAGAGRAPDPGATAPPDSHLEHLSASRRQVAHYRQAVEHELGALRESIAAHRGFAEQQESVDVWPLDPERRDELKLRVHARLMPIFDQLPRGTLLERSVVADLLDVFAEERAIELAAARRAADAEVEQLERRIAKLVTSLEANESLLESVVAAKAGDPGIASQYREVQGLDDKATEHMRRAAIMEQIFEANVELQKRIAKDQKRTAKQQKRIAKEQKV